MIFTLEALDADHGDALLLHYGTVNNPKLILIDGGPSAVTYDEVIKKRLLRIKKKLAPSKSVALPIQMVMVSHIDDDHIDGLLAMTDQLIDMDEHSINAPFAINTLWFNSFDDILDNDQTELFGALSASVMAAGIDARMPGMPVADSLSAAIAASVNQGRSLRDNAARLAIPLNAEAGAKLVSAPKTGGRQVDFGNGLKLTVLAPSESRLKRLQTKWRATLRDLEKKKKKEREEAIAQALAGTSKRDTSVANLASIVVLAEAGDKTMLLTGDALDNDIVAGLKTAGLLDNGRLHVDILKLPHHGSDRNVSSKFFKTVTADHYVISADGRHGNPDPPTLEMLDKARFAIREEVDPDAFTIHLTHRTGKEGLGTKLDKFIEEKEERKRKYKMVFRDDRRLSMKIELLDKIRH